MRSKTAEQVIQQVQGKVAYRVAEDIGSKGIAHPAAQAVFRKERRISGGIHTILPCCGKIDNMTKIFKSIIYALYIKRLLPLPPRHILAYFRLLLEFPGEV